MMGGRAGRRLGLYALVTLALIVLSYRLLPPGMSLSCPPVMVPRQVSTEEEARSRVQTLSP